MMNNRTYLAAMILLAAVSAHIAGATPWYTQDPRTLPQGKWRVEEHALYSDFDNGLLDGHSTALPGGATDASAFILHTRVRYGVTDNLTVFADAPYVEKRVHTPAAVVDNSGWGDVSLLAKYKYAEDKKAGTRRAVALLYKTHTGEYRGLSGLAATGSGQDNIALLHLWEWDRGATNWYANLGYVYTDSRDDTGRNPGDQVLFNLASEHRFGQSPWQFVWEVNGVYEGHATQPGTTSASGSTVVSLTPGVQYVQKRPGGRMTTWEAGVQVPTLKRGNAQALQDYQLYVGAYTVF
jgi:hypothetical protein